MCIAAIAWQLFDDMPLVLLSNRDEFLDRPTQPVHQWQEVPIFAGRDIKSGGSWLGFHQSADGKQNGRWAAVLNFRDGVQATSDQCTRGELVTNFLISQSSPITYARQINLKNYAGFNLIVGNGKQAVLVNNRGYPPTPLYAGLHILSNGQPDTAWFKCERLRALIRQEVLPLISENSAINYWQHAAFTALSDKQMAPAEELPDTGVDKTIEAALSSIYIDAQRLGNYGTRTQSILTLQHKFDPKLTLTVQQTADV